MKGVSHLSDPFCELADEIMRVNGRMRSLFAGATAAAHLSPMAYATFIYIAESKSPPTVPQIGRSLAHARQVIQRAVNELLEAGIVQTTPNPNHKRAPLLELSAAGRAFKQESDNRVLALAKELSSYVAEAESEEVVRRLRSVRSGIEAYIRDSVKGAGHADHAMDGFSRSLGRRTSRPRTDGPRSRVRG